MRYRLSSRRRSSAPRHSHSVDNQLDHEWGPAANDKDLWLPTINSSMDKVENHSGRRRSLVCPTPRTTPAQSEPLSLPPESTAGALSEASLPEDSPDETYQSNDSLGERRKRFRRLFMRLLQGIPIATWAVVLGIMFSLIQPLKALLTETPGWTGSRVPNAPDGNPPLSFFLQTTKYLGAVTVPLALILLGSSFARLKVSGVAQMVY